jgi:hypothetical protein
VVVCLLLGLAFAQSRAGVSALFLTRALVAFRGPPTNRNASNTAGAGARNLSLSRFPGNSGLLHHSRCFTAIPFRPPPPPPQPQPLFTKATTTSQPAQHNNHRRLLCTLQAQCIQSFPAPPKRLHLRAPIALAATSCSLRPATRTRAAATILLPQLHLLKRPPSGTHPHIIILPSTQLLSPALLTDYPSSSLKVKASCAPSQSLISLTLVNLDTESIWSQQNPSWRSSRPQ